MKCGILVLPGQMNHFIFLYEKDVLFRFLREIYFIFFNVTTANLKCFLFNTNFLKLFIIMPIKNVYINSVYTLRCYIFFTL
jgi:hypothetical protein